MTEIKLPEVGKRYRSYEGFLIEINIVTDEPRAWIEYKHCIGGGKGRVVTEVFWDYFEELPEEPTSAGNAQVEESLVDKIYRLEAEIIMMESDLGCKKALLRTLERKLNRAVQAPTTEKSSDVEPFENLEELKSADLCLDAKLDLEYCRGFWAGNNNAVVMIAGNKDGQNRGESVERSIHERALKAKKIIKQFKTTTTNKTVNLKKEDEVQISKVDKALEELKKHLDFLKLYQNKPDSLCYLEDKAQNLVNALEVERKPKRDDQTDSLDGCLYELRYEVEYLQRDESLKIKSESIVEDMLQKQLWSLINRATNVIHTAEDLKLLSKPEPKIDMKEGGDDSIKIKSLNWFPDPEHYNPPKLRERGYIWKPVSELPAERNQVVVKCANGNIGLCFYEYEKFNLTMLVTGKDNDGKDIIGLRNIINVTEWCYLADYINNIEERLRRLEDNKN